MIFDVFLVIFDFFTNIKMRENHPKNLTIFGGPQETRIHVWRGQIKSFAFLKLVSSITDKFKPRGEVHLNFKCTSRD